MKVETTKTNTYIKGLKKAIPPSIILYFDNGNIIVSWDFNHRRTQPLECLVYISAHKKWIKTKLLNDYTEIMWNHHRKIQRKSRSKCNCTNLMKHDRKHKKGGGGGRIGYAGTVTDYECRKEPFHDFRRSMYVQWN